MFNLSRELGIKSYSFRHIQDNVEVAAAVKECQSTVIDLSACHVDYDNVEAQERTIATYRQAGIRVGGIGVVGLKNEEAFNRRFFAFAQRAGCEVISCNFDPQDHESILALTEKLCDEYGLRAAIHNHGGKHWLGNSTILRYVFNKTSSRIGLCLDTAWCLQAGEDPSAWLDWGGERLYAIHFKDFEFDRRGRYADTVVGHGALDLPAFLEKFATLPFSGPAVVEFEGEDAVTMSARCVRAIREACAGK